MKCDPPINWNWDEITAISTLVLAVVTAIMAAVTAWMARNTKKALKQNDELRSETNKHYEQTRAQGQQHHEDGFRPLLILAPAGGVGSSDRRNLIYVENQIGSQKVFINGPIQNIGDGPALNVQIFVRKDERTGFGPSMELSPIAGGGHLVPHASGFVLPVLNEVLNHADLDGLWAGSWIIVLEYQDIFGNRFHTLHYKNALQPWARTGRGPAPDTTPTLPG